MADAPSTDAPVETTDAPAALPAPTGETPKPDGDDVATWKAWARKHELAAKKAAAELSKLQQASLSEQERAVALARDEGRAEGQKAANERLLRAEVRALAAGVLVDPDVAVQLLDLSGYEPNESGEFDRKAIRRDLEDLVKAKPYLAPGPGSGAGEGGARGAPAPNSALNGDPLLNSVKDKLGIR